MSINAPGVGSGLDVNGLVGQLMSLERRPLLALNSREAGVQARISAFGQLTGLVSELQSAANELNDPTNFAATKTTVGAGAGFTATSDATASAGNYNVEVVARAQTQRLAIGSNAFTPGAGMEVSAGTLTIGFGTAAELNAGTPDKTVDIDFDGGTLDALRNAINDAKTGVTANIINDGSVQRLVLSGDETGSEQAFSVQGLGVSFDPTVPGAEGDPVFQLQAAQNSQIKVDGLPISRGSNTIDDVIDGVALTLTGDAAASSLTVGNDFSGARNSIDAFVKAYNDTISGINTLTAYNPDTRTGAALNGDATARTLQSQVRDIVGSAFNDVGATSRLADLGVTFQRDGRLLVDGNKLTAAFNDPSRDVGSFFTGADGKAGFATQVSEVLGNFIGREGLISNRTDGLSSSVKDIESQRVALNRRLETVEARFRAQFSALDSMIASMTQTSNFLGQQLANLPGSFGG